jgi:hypothetical protein
MRLRERLDRAVWRWEGQTLRFAVVCFAVAWAGSQAILALVRR